MSRVLASLALAAVLLACGRVPTLPAPTAPPPPERPSTPPPAPRPAALYGPAQTYGVSEPERFTVEDPDRVGGARSIPVAVRRPVGAEGTRPIVIWSHGGSDGKTDPLRSGPAWGEALATAGYVVVSVAHPPRPRCEMPELCRHVGFPSRDDSQAGFRSVKWDRQHDLSAVIDWVEALAAHPRWSDHLDVARIVLGGHSAGSGGVAELAGAVRTHGPADVGSRRDPRPVAFLLLALQGPAELKGFDDSAWDTIDRPVFGATGLGDITAGDAPENRVRVFDSLRSPGSRLLWVEDAASAHTLFNLETTGCERAGATRQHCAELVDIVRSSAIAFLDAEVVGRQDALEWLAATDFRSATDGLAWWLAP